MGNGNVASGVTIHFDEKSANRPVKVADYAFVVVGGRSAWHGRVAFCSSLGDYPPLIYKANSVPVFPQPH
jgi:hypothetical protein